MLLHAKELAFLHPVSEELIRIDAAFDDTFQQVFELLNFKG